MGQEGEGVAQQAAGAHTGGKLRKDKTTVYCRGNVSVDSIANTKLTFRVQSYDRHYDGWLRHCALEGGGMLT